LDILHAKDEECEVYTFILLKIGIGRNYFGVVVANEMTNNNEPIKVIMPKSNDRLLTTSNTFIFFLSTCKYNKFHYVRH